MPVIVVYGGNVPYSHCGAGYMANYFFRRDGRSTARHAQAHSEEMLLERHGTKQLTVPISGPASTAWTDKILSRLTPSVGFYDSLMPHEVIGLPRWSSDTETLPL